MKRLKHKPDIGIAEAGKGIFTQEMQAVPVQDHRAGRRTVQASAETQQGGFAAARWTDNGAGRTRGERKRDILEDSECPGSGVIGFANMLHVQNRSCLHMTCIVCRGVALIHCQHECRGSGRCQRPRPGDDETQRDTPMLFFGDSLTAGYGLAPSQAFPALIQEKITARGWDFHVVNAGLSGETTAGGLRRIDWVLQRPIAVLILALGANDGLRGLPIAEARRNLQAIIDRARHKYPQVKIVLAGMQVPTNLGREYTTGFRTMFPELAAANTATLIPFLLEGVGGIPA